MRSHHRTWGHPRTIMAMILREMSSRYGRNPGGYVWAVLEPLGMIAFLALGFALVLRAPSLGNSFILFYASGYLPYNLFNKVSAQVMLSIHASSNLLKYPAVTWVDAVSSRVILNILTETLIAYLLMVGILMTLDHSPILDFGPILLSFVLAASLGLGIGLINCVLVGFIPVWRTVWRIFTRPQLLASGVLYVYEDLPQMAGEILWYNPLMHVTGLAHEGYYHVYEPQFISVVYVMGLSMGLTALGLLLMRRYHLEILSRR